MTIRDLEIFLEVVKQNNMSVAAKALNISQPTVSHAIAQIEDEYDIILFERASKKLFLTDVGYRFYNRAKKILSELYNLDVEFKNNQNHISLGIHNGIPTPIVVDFSKKMKDQYDLDIMFVITERELMLDMLKRGELDAVLTDYTYDLEECDFTPGFKLTYKLATDKKNVADFPNNLEFIYWAGTDKNVVFDELAHKFPVEMKYRVGNIDSALRLMETEKVYTFLPAYTIRESDEFEVLDDLTFSKKFKLYYMRDKYITKKMKILMSELAKAHYEE